ncbi:MAG: hypothetical protein ABSB50_10505 [Terracidiphilus sp.]|jgi:hypothetical protein
MSFSLICVAASRIRRTRAVAPIFLALLLLAALPLSSQGIPSAAESKSPDLDSILQPMEDAQHQNRAQSRPYQVTREYEVFMGSDKQPTSEVMAQIDFVPPTTETYKITQSKGNSWGEKIIRQLLASETESARKAHGPEVSRAYYDFVFLREQDFDGVPEYVLAIFPKRKDKYLLRGQIWVNKNTFRIRQIQGVPAESPSFWLTDLHITLQYAEVGGLWVLVAVDGLAKVRFLGQFTLTGINIPPSASSTPAAN